jgi:hypothetical protein
VNDEKEEGEKMKLGKRVAGTGWTMKRLRLATLVLSTIAIVSVSVGYATELPASASATGERCYNDAGKGVVCRTIKVNGSGTYVSTVCARADAPWLYAPYSGKGVLRAWGDRFYFESPQVEISYAHGKEWCWGIYQYLQNGSWVCGTWRETSPAYRDYSPACVQIIA